jgi:hypothetical protein
MEKSVEMKEILRKIIYHWKKDKNSAMFYDSGVKVFFFENLSKLVSKLPIFTEELLDIFKKVLAKDDIIGFLLDIREGEIGDCNNFLIVQYIFRNFDQEQIKKYTDRFYKNLPHNHNEWMEYVNLISNYDFVDMKKMMYASIFESHSLNRMIKIWNKYTDSLKKANILEKENEQMKKRIQELELQIQYMPGGDGYLEAKEHFESFK